MPRNKQAKPNQSAYEACIKWTVISDNDNRHDFITMEADNSVFKAHHWPEGFRNCHQWTGLPRRNQRSDGFSQIEPSSCSDVTNRCDLTWREIGLARSISPRDTRAWINLSLAFNPDIRKQLRIDPTTTHVHGTNDDDDVDDLLWNRRRCINIRVTFPWFSKGVVEIV